MSRKTSDVFRTSFLTMDGTLDPNNSQLFFRPLQAPLNTTGNSFYSLGAAQSNDPNLRINKYDSSGQLEGFGYLYDTAYNPPPPAKFIMVAGGTGPFTPLIYSQDRQSWNYSQFAELYLTSCLAIAYDGFIWVAGGIGTRTVIYSSNGTTWTDISGASNILTGQCSAIATNGDFWIAGGRSNVNCAICFSYDLVAWYNTSSIIVPIFGGGNVAAIAYNGFFWLAGGTGSIAYPIAYSNDGIYWTGSVQAQPLLNECYALTWNGSIWLAGGNYNGDAQILYSANGIDWIVSDLNGTIPTSVRAIGWNGTILVAGGYDSSFGGRTLAYSYDGITWSATPSPTFITLCDTVAWDGITWQAGGDGGIFTSPDGIIWTINGIVPNYLPQVNAIAIDKILPLVAPKTPNPSVTAPLSLIAGTNPQFGSGIGYSTDGISWTFLSQVSSITRGARIEGLSWNGFIWVAGVGQRGPPIYSSEPRFPTLIYSYDGITWTGSQSAFTVANGAVYKIAWGKDKFIAIADFYDTGNISKQCVIKSSDGINWTRINSLTTASIGFRFAIAYNGTAWVLTGTNETFASSIQYSLDDGVTWQSAASATSIFPLGAGPVAWNGRVWSVAAGPSIVAYSTDAINWTRGTIHGLSNGNTLSMTTNDSIFIMTVDVLSGSVNSNIFYSYDGIDYYQVSYVPGGLDTIPWSATWTGTLWIATGFSRSDSAIGYVLYSYNGMYWYPSSNGSQLLTTGFPSNSATNRVNPTAGNTLPPAVLNQDITPLNGYGILTSNANNLYKSSTLYMNDASGILGINQTTLNYTDMTSVSIGPVVEMSGGGITVNTYTSNAVPGLYMTASNVLSGSGNSAGRVELYDAINQFGWQIDNNVGTTNRFKIQSKFRTNPVQLGIDIRNDANTIGIGITADNTNRLLVQGDVLVTGDLIVNATKSFLIDHPNPALKETHLLRHCCVEGPTRGETLYRWTLITSNGSCVQALPSYSVHLNENWQFFVSPKNSFGTGYVVLSQDERTFTLFGSEDGPYSVVGVATRKDKGALAFDKKGVEALKE
jgi:hypothetical protein